VSSGAGGSSKPRKNGIRGCIPAEISSVERSSARGISECEGLNSWPLDSKNSRKPARSSAVVRMAAILRAVDFGTERWIDAVGTSLQVRSWGEDIGRAVLYWHGVGLTSRGGASLGEAAPQLMRDRRLRVVALDAPGFGGSPAFEPARYHPHALADLVPALLDALELERVAFMGYSWGGDVGCHVAARYPDRVSALVLLDAGYRDPPFDPALPYEQRLEQNRELAACTEGVCVDPAVIAAVEHGIAQALPSTTRARLSLPCCSWRTPLPRKTISRASGSTSRKPRSSAPASRGTTSSSRVAP
jgi:pimeloyl-ACP methyl ester carboxylesterase